MTSVQNLRQPLSGNKWILIPLLLTGLCGCGSARYTTGQDYTPIITTPIENTQTDKGETDSGQPAQQEAVAIIETSKSAKEQFDPKGESFGTLSSKKLEMRYKTFDVPSSIAKDTYTIALILPFQLGKVPNTVSDPRTVTFTTATKIAAEFYQGAQKALDSLKTLPLNLKVYILDADSDTGVGKSLLTQPPFPAVDLIIGPVYNSNLRIYAQYALEHKIPIISPLSSSASITQKNPYYFSANATARTHYYTILNRILQDEPAASLWVLKGSNSETEETPFAMEVFNEDFAPQFPAAKLNVIKYIAGDSMLLARHFSLNRTNHLLIPSYNQSFIQEAMNLTTHVDSLVPLRIYGTSKWNEYKIDFSVNPFVTIYITNSYYNNANNTFARNYREMYEEENRRYPSEYTEQGFDLLWYIGNLLSTGDFFSGIEQGKTVTDHLQTEFSFAPVYTKEDPMEIDYFDNKFVHWLFYSQGKFIKAW